MDYSLIFLFLAGAFGALAKDIVEDNAIKLPKKVNGDFSLGFIGGMVVGGVTGYLVDGNLTTAFLAGYAGTAVIENLLLAKNSQTIPLSGLNEAIIRKVANEECVNPDLAVRVAKCESNLNHKALNTNKDGSQDRGLYQINNKYHPEISDEEAFNPIFATKFFCKAFKGGNLSWWDATRKCWEK